LDDLHWGLYGKKDKGCLGLKTDPTIPEKDRAETRFLSEVFIRISKHLTTTYR